MDRSIRSVNYQKIEIVRATSRIKISISDIRELIQQLTSKKISFDSRDYNSLISYKNCSLYLAMDLSENRKTIGMVAVVQFIVPTSKHARIEDLVVDQKYRGRGIGKKLMQAAIDSLKESGAIHIELTSNSQREAANRLYQNLGFKQIKTNVYRLYL